jgi:hypothetical protein
VARDLSADSQPRAWLVQDIEADVCELTSNGWWVLYRDEIVIGSVRQVIALPVEDRPAAPAVRQRLALSAQHPREWLPASHLAWLLIEVVAELDLSKLHAGRAPGGVAGPATTRR